MKITGNFSTPNFKRLYIHERVQESIERLKVSDDEDTRESLQDNMRRLRAYGETADILMTPYGKNQEGLRVQYIEVTDPRTYTYKVTKNISYHKDFIEGLRAASRRLGNDSSSRSNTYSIKNISRNMQTTGSEAVVIGAGQLNAYA